jgi:hypothetical protein
MSQKKIICLYLMDSLICLRLIIWFENLPPLQNAFERLQQKVLFAFV